MHRQALPSNRAKGLRPHKGLHDAHHGRLRGRPCRASLPRGQPNPGFARAHNPEALQGRPAERPFSTARLFATARPFPIARPFYPCVVRGKVLCLYGCAPWLVAWRRDKPQRGDPFQSPGCVALQGDQTLGSPVSIITKPCRGDPQERTCSRSLWVALCLSTLGTKSLGWVITIFTTFDRHILRLVPS